MGKETYCAACSTLFPSRTQYSKHHCGTSLTPESKTVACSNADESSDARDLVPISKGTRDLPFFRTIEDDGGVISHVQVITSMTLYEDFSFEELRLGDYVRDGKFPPRNGQPMFLRFREPVTASRLSLFEGDNQGSKVVSSIVPETTVQSLTLNAKPAALQVETSQAARSFSEKSSGKKTAKASTIKIKEGPVVLTAKEPKAATLATIQEESVLVTSPPNPKPAVTKTGRIKIIVGTQQFIGPKAALATVSTYFRNTFDDDILENTLTFNNIGPDIFRIFIGWVKNKKLMTAKGEEVKDYATLIELYIFATRYDVPKMRDDLLTIIWERYMQERSRSSKMAIASFAFSLRLIAQAFSNLPETSPLCRFLIDVTAWDSFPAGLNEEERKAFNEAEKFLVGLWAVCSDRLPLRKAGEVAPFDQGTKAYYEHKE